MPTAVLIFLVALACFASAEPGCEEKADPGMCRGYFPRFWFDPKSQQCLKFVYGGCEGNANNYLTEDACLAVCAL